MSRSVIRQKQNFYKRLKLLGYRNYNEYLQSTHWKNKKIEYRNSEMLQHCLFCENKNYILHHRSYVRLGDESLYDFIPLCQDCHRKVHEWFNTHEDIQIAVTHRAIREIFKLTRPETRTLFKKIAKKGVFKFKDNTRVDILKASFK